MTELLVVGGALFLAYANGANDTFKGVATLWGSGVASYRAALAWATISTLCGSLAAAVYADELIQLFTGRGLVPDAVVGTPAFLFAVAGGAAFTVLGAAIRGLPLSTTHALVGGLVGAGFAATDGAVDFATLWQSFVLPLAVSPFVPVVALAALHAPVRRLVLPSRNGATLVSASSAGPPTAGKVPDLGRRSVDGLHFLSAGTVGFARGLNDTPKIVGVALTADAFGLEMTTFAIAAAMTLGGLFQARRIAETLSHRLTPLTPARGALANLVTSTVVIVATHVGAPVSTTHVAVGAITGIGIAERNANWRLLLGIASAWVLTLPVALILSSAIYATWISIVGP